jgi:RNAse (barnase) inhibitor barstar
MEIIEIDGSQFRTLEEFFAHFGERALVAPWGANLDAFNDVLRGGFGTPSTFVVRWKNHAISRHRLGYQETIRQLELRLLTCHPANRETVAKELASSKRHEGSTVFDWLVEIFQAHGPGGVESEDQVYLELA